jgi:plastocyanin
MRWHVLRGLGCACVAACESQGGSSAFDAGAQVRPYVPADAETAGDVTPSDGGKDATFSHDSDAPEAAPAAVNGCSAFEDHSAPTDARTLAWTYTIATDPARCMQIHAGQSVTWSGSLTEHPLLAAGGDVPNPIAGPKVGASGNVAFPAAGTFGYRCANHAFMTGAIRVLP